MQLPCQVQIICQGSGWQAVDHAGNCSACRTRDRCLDEAGGARGASCPNRQRSAGVLQLTLVVDRQPRLLTRRTCHGARGRYGRRRRVVEETGLRAKTNESIQQGETVESIVSRHSLVAMCCCCPPLQQRRACRPSLQLVRGSILLTWLAQSRQLGRATAPALLALMKTKGPRKTQGGLLEQDQSSVPHMSRPSSGRHVTMHMSSKDDVRVDARSASF
jgi:hypothetical protein